MKRFAVLCAGLLLLSSLTGCCCGLFGGGSGCGYGAGYPSYGGGGSCGSCGTGGYGYPSGSLGAGPTAFAPGAPVAIAPTPATAYHPTQTAFAPLSNGVGTW